MKSLLIFSQFYEATNDFYMLDIKHNKAGSMKKQNISGKTNKRPNSPPYLTFALIINIYLIKARIMIYKNNVYRYPIECRGK